MKLDKSFLTLFVGLAMAACSNDEEMATGGQDLLPIDGREAYMSVVVDMPKSTETRSWRKSRNSGRTECKRSTPCIV